MRGRLSGVYGYAVSCRPCLLYTSEKVAKVRALRETFIEDLGGMYEAEEMGVDLPKDNTVQSNVVIEQNEPIDVEYMPVDDVVSMDAI